MNRAIFPTLIALIAALGLALAVERGSLSETRREVELLQSRIDRLEGRQKDAAGRRALEELQSQVTRAERKAAEASSAAEAAAAAAAKNSTRSAPAPVSFSEEDIQKIVEAKLEEKLQARGAGKPDGGGDRKMPLFDLARELSLDPAAQAKITAIANTAKKEIFDILKTPRPDGTNVADEVIAAFMSGEPAQAQKVFAKLFTEKIPGTDTPYVSAVSAAQQKANQGLAQAMGSDAYGRFQGMNIKPENIETGFDPWQDYIQQRGK